MITDILYGGFIPNVAGNGPAASARNTFVVNNAAADVPLDVTTNPEWLYVFGAPSNFNLVGTPYYTKVQSKDSVTLLSFGLMMPYHFVLSQIAEFYLGYYCPQEALPACKPILELQNGAGDLVIPFVNYEMSLGVYFSWPAHVAVPAAADYYYLCGLVNGGRVSQIGTPAILNGVSITPVPFMKIQHTLPLLH
jgi:hypothetical protein